MEVNEDTCLRGDNIYENKNIYLIIIEVHQGVIIYKSMVFGCVFYVTRIKMYYISVIYFLKVNRAQCRHIYTKLLIIKVNLRITYINKLTVGASIMVIAYKQIVL